MILAKNTFVNVYRQYWIFICEPLCIECWNGDLEGVFSRGNTPEGLTETHTSSFSPYKQASGRNGDHEWIRMTNTFIVCDLLWKLQKKNVAYREGSFNCNHIASQSHVGHFHEMHLIKIYLSDGLDILLSIYDKAIQYALHRWAPHTS